MLSVDGIARISSNDHGLLFSLVMACYLLTIAAWGILAVKLLMRPRKARRLPRRVVLALPVFVLILVVLLLGGQKAYVLVEPLALVTLAAGLLPWERLRGRRTVELMTRTPYPVIVLVLVVAWGLAILVPAATSEPHKFGTLSGEVAHSDVYCEAVGCLIPLGTDVMHVDRRRLVECTESREEGTRYLARVRVYTVFRIEAKQVRVDC